MKADLGRITEGKALKLALPDRGYTLHWCPQTPGFGVRVTAAGSLAWIAERRVSGKTVRRTLGRGAVSADAARKLMVEVSSELQRGIDRVDEDRAARIAHKKVAAETSLTLAEALSEYASKKRRGKDGLPLKERTVADYQAMVAAGESKSGRPLVPGKLLALAGKPLAHITADDVRTVYRTASARGARRATYAMQVLRAVLNWHCVKVPGNPLSRDVAGKDRIVLGKTAGPGAVH